MQGWGVKTIAGLGMLAGWFLACAGEDIPPVDDELRGALADGFGGAADGQMASAGSSGSGNAGRGGSGSGNGGRGGSGTSGSANTAGSDSGGGAGGGAPVGGSGSGGGGVAECDAFPIIQEKCGTVGCHGAGSGQGAFGVSEDGLAEFIDKPSTYGRCDGVYIDSANPEASLIYTKLSEDFPDGCGNLQMPANGDFLSADDTACVLGWLQQFAD